MNKLRRNSICVVVLLVALALASVPTLVAQTDHGSRPVGNQSVPAAGPTNTSGVSLLTTPVLDTVQPADANGNEGAGNPIRQPDPQVGFWFNTIAIFGQLASVNGGTDTSINPFTGKPNNNPTLLGLGPAFNGNSCFMCHSQPAIGGSSPATGTPGFSQNPQLLVAHALGGTNSENLSSFLKANGPIREARFILNENDSTKKQLDGGVHELFSIQGRSDAASNCSLLQPDFTTQIANNNVIFRIPIPLFGEGLVENVSDADFAANAALENFNSAGIAAGIQNAVLNRSPNDGTVSRFGWKAQNKSLLLFAGEAANVELGVTNELFGNEKVPGSNCATNQLPEDNTRISFQAGSTPPDVDAFVSSAVESFAVFMRLNGAPAQCDFASTVDSTGAAVCNALGTSAQNGRQVFDKVGCNLCHTESFTTQPSNIGGLSNRLFQPFSDFGLHHMGATLADGVTQGGAGPDMFRTAPLWGLGQRFFFLHDGRASNLLDAIAAHQSDASICFDTTDNQSFTVKFPLTTGATVAFSPSATTHSCGSEANAVVTNFNNLSVSNKQDLLNFLRSL
jgi:CxxC motif-containing protein (DUF1111 family)